MPSNFTGVVKLFPLPNLVLFPGVIQPLHIFEPRYRKMMEDAINSDQVIAMAMLKPSNSGLASKQPEIHRTICVGKIVTHAQLPDGRFNLLLLGAKRAEIIREIPSDLPYRLADVKLIESDNDPMSDPDHCLRRQAIELFERVAALDDKLNSDALGHLNDDSMPLGLLLDLLAFSCGTSLEHQQEILETIDVDARAKKVIEILQSRLAKSRNSSLQFPPQFSYN